MDLSRCSASELNGIAKSKLYLAVPGLANQIFEQFIRVADVGERIEDPEFWEYLFGDALDSQPNGPLQGHPPPNSPLQGSPKRRRIEPQQGEGVDEGQQLEEEEPYTIAFLGEKKAARFRATCMAYSMRFSDTIYPHEALLNGCSDLIERCFSDGGLRDKVTMRITHPDLRKPIGIPCSTRETLTAERVLRVIEQFVQSSETVRFDGQWEVEAVRFAAPQTAGRPPTPVNLTKFLESKTGPNGCLMKIVNKDDQLCFPR